MPNAYAAATSTTTTLKAALTSAATTAITTAPYGSSLTLTATIAPTAAAGTVTFLIGGVAQGSPVAVSSGTAKLVTSALAMGANSLTATFTPTTPASYATSTSAAVTFTETQATTTTTLAAGLTSAPATAITTAAYGASVTMTATVAPAVAGTVSFQIGGVAQGSPVAVTSGTASLATTALALGANSLTAVFTPTTPADYTSSTSAAKTVTVSAAPTTTTMTAALTSAPSTTITTAPSGSSVTLTATVTPTVAGTVTFMDGSTTLGSPVTVSSGTASLVTTALTTIGANSLTATFAPTVSADYASSTSSALSITVTKPAATTTLAVSAGPYYYDSSVTLTASVSPSSATGTVTFYDGSTSLGTGTLSSGTAALSVSTLTVATHNITAAYGGNSSYSASTSAATPVAVVATPTQIALQSSASAITTGTAITLTATVTAQAGSATVTAGSVTFWDSTTNLGKATVNSSGIATLSNVHLTTSGANYLLAMYGGVYSSSVAEFGVSLSAAAKVDVNTGQTITFTQPTAGIYGTTVTLSATSTSGLTVSFTASGACSVTGSTLSYTGVGAGACTVTAQQAGNNTYTAATPVSYNVTVNPATQTIGHWSNLSTTYGTPLTFSASATSGGTVTYSVISGPGSISGTTLTPTGVGSVVVGATVAATADYAAVTTPVTKTMTVYQAPLVITASSPSAITFGAPVPTITPTYTSLVNGDTPTSLTTQPTCKTAYTTSSAAGSYSTYCYGAVDSKYSITYAAGSFTVNKLIPTVSSWPTDSAITYGAALSTSTLTGGTASVAGAFAWSSSPSPTTTIPRVGSSQSVTFTPTNTTDYATVTGTISANVNKANLAVAVSPTASAVPYDSALSASRLSGGTVYEPNTSIVLPGTFAWTTSSTTLTTMGSNSEGVTFTATDSTDYNLATGTANVTVDKATPAIASWPTAAAIPYGQALSSSVLSFTSNGSGTFAWTNPSAVPSVGTSAESVTFTPTDTTHYTTAMGTAHVTVSSLAPTVSSWPTASSITFGQALSSSMLSGGSANVSGSFSWTNSSTTPDAGTLSEGVTFTPTNQTLYSVVTGAVNVTVNQESPIVSSWPTASSITSLQTLSNSILTGGTASVDGSFVWTAAGTSLVPGTTSYSVTFTPSDSTDYSSPIGWVNVTVNPCGLQDSTNLSYSAALYLFTDGDAPVLPAAFGAQGINESAICAVNLSPTDTIAATVTYPFITSNAMSTNPADSNAYGTNAAILAFGTVATAGTGATITINDDGSGDPGSISTTYDNSTGVFASMGGTVNINDTIISTSGNSSHGLDATYQGTLNITNAQAYTVGNNSGVITAGIGGGNVTIAGGNYTSSGSHSAGIRVAGTGSTVAVSDGAGGTNITTQNGPAVVIEGGNSVSITSTGGTAISGALGDDHGIFFYQGSLGDATAGTSTFTMTNGSLTYTCDATLESVAPCPTGLASSDQNSPATLFAVANTTAVINLTDVTVTNTTPTDADSNGTLLTAAALNSGTTGSNGGVVTFNAQGETLVGDIIVDAISTANLSLAADTASNPVPSILTGTINGANSGGTVNLTLDATSTWVVTGNSYLTTLNNAVAGNSNITCYYTGQCSVYVGGQLLSGVN
ncbi:MAG: Ig-like domain repeat protein [Candidatus Korobacteraceae bacterium]